MVLKSAEAFSHSRCQLAADRLAAAAGLMLALHWPFGPCPLDPLPLRRRSRRTPVTLGIGRYRHSSLSAREATGHWQRPDVHLARILFSLPALTSAFLSLQFFLLLAPPGECPTFLRWKYLTDFSVKAIKPEYCMGLDTQVQVHG